MHRTQTVDYGIVLEGEITMILDLGETTIKAAISLFKMAPTMHGQTALVKYAGWLLY
jgi:hypothetical protein